MKRKLSLALAAVMLFTGISFQAAFTVSAESADGSNMMSKIVTNRNLYSSYCAQREDYPNATATVTVDAVNYTAAHGAQVEKVNSFEGKNGVLKWTNEDGTVDYKINIPANGKYAVKFVYYAMPSRNNPVSLSLKIDGKSYFDGMNEFELPRLYTDDGDPRVDGLGNEFAPEQKEVFRFQEYYFSDQTGMESEPYTLSLSAGEHTVTVGSVAEPVALDAILFTQPESFKPYKEVKAGYADLDADTDGEVIKLEGEDADYKSTNSLISQYDQTDPSVSSKSGSDPYLTRINYIGNTNWASPGQRLTWEFDVKTSGYYKLAFRYKQNLVLNGTSCRKLYIDGEVPFKEAANIKFNYGLNWEMMEFCDSKDKPYYVYLKEGKHTIAMEVNLGDMTSAVSALNNVMYDVGTLYRKIVMITGETPDNSRDYDLYQQIPNFNKDLKAYSKELKRIAAELEKIAGKDGNSNSTSIRAMANVLDNMLKNKFTAHQYKSTYYSNYTSVSSLVYIMMDMGLNLDYIQITPKGQSVTDPKASWFQKFGFSFNRFLSSFSGDYDNISGDVQTEKTITIWANWGRDQIRVLNNLIQSSFTPKTNIGVNLKMSNASYIQAILSGNGPDCSLHMARSEPVNLALRGAMYDLKQFSDYETVMQRFMTKDSAVPFTFQNGVYALPDTINFYMMFYRTDIFEQYDLKVPTTWDEFIQVSSVLYRNKLQASLPYTQITTAAMVNAGVGSLSIYPSLLMQMGGKLYDDGLTKTTMTTPEGIKAFQFWTDFYTEYKFPVTADFFNRFRTGTMPLGIQNYTLYINLTLAAPEITNKWKMVPIPGFQQADGTIKNVQAGSGTGCGILKISKNKAGGWEFLKWWTSADTQLSYSNNCESILGVAGRVATSNVEAFKGMGWDKDSLNALLSQWSKLQEVPELPGSYYTSRSIDQAYWNVVNNSENAKDMIIKWSDIADQEITRKREQYHVQ